MEAGDILIIQEKPKKKSPIRKKSDGDTRIVVIYKLEIAETKFLYIGSTQDFTQRKKLHKISCANNLNPESKNRNRNCPLYSEINRNGGWSKVTMSPLEEFEATSTIQSRIREQYWIDKIQIARRDAVLMNSVRAFVTPEQIIESTRKYHETNREERNAKCLATNSKKMTCGCGVEHSVGDKSRHLKTAKHIAWEKAKDQEFIDRLDNEMDKIIEKK